MSSSDVAPMRSLNDGSRRRSPPPIGELTLKGFHRAIAAAGLTVAVAFAPIPSTAQTADRPEVKAGDRWQFAVYYSTPSAAPNRTWVVRAVTRERIEGTENGEPLVLTRDLTVLESPAYRQSDSRLLMFPLEVGKQWRTTSDWLFKSKGSKGSSVTDVSVLAYERVRVPAGEFDAFRLEARAAMRGVAGIGSRIDATTTTTYWYAPAARAVVRSVHHNPYLGTSTVDLVSFEPRP